MEDKKKLEDPPYKTCFGSAHMSDSERAIERLRNMTDEERRRLSEKLQDIAEMYGSGGP